MPKIAFNRRANDIAIPAHRPVHSIDNQHDMIEGLKFEGRARHSSSPSPHTALR